MEFKGTKGDWKLKGNEIHCNNLLVGYATNSFFRNSINDTEAKYNAQLISKAKEMLEMLQNVLDNVSEEYSKLKEDIEKLIEEATKID